MLLLKTGWTKCAICQQDKVEPLRCSARIPSARVMLDLFICLFFPPFIYFTSHLYCITRFEDEDAICRINIRLQE